MIISDENQGIREQIMQSTQKGITVVEDMGGYSADNKQVVFCAVEQADCTSISNVIREIDQNAFIVVTDTREVIGRSYTPII